MNRSFARISVCLLMVMPCSAGADGWEMLAKKMVVSEGPYEVKDEGGVIGFVVAYKGEMVTFKPCVGDTFAVERKRLVKTKNKCKDSPSSDENPLVANCNDVTNVWNAMQVEQVRTENHPVGTTIYSKDGTLASIDSKPEELAADLNAVAVLKDCGAFTVGFDKRGKPAVNLIQVFEANQMENQQ